MTLQKSCQTTSYPRSRTHRDVLKHLHLPLESLHISCCLYKHTTVNWLLIELHEILHIITIHFILCNHTFILQIGGTKYNSCWVIKVDLNKFSTYWKICTNNWTGICIWPMPTSYYYRWFLMLHRKLFLTFSLFWCYLLPVVLPLQNLNNVLSESCDNVMEIGFLITIWWAR